VKISERATPWEIARPYVLVFDPILTVALALLLAFSLVTMYSAAYEFPGRFNGHLRNILVALLLMWVAANVKPTQLMSMAVPVYLLGLALLVAVALFGDISKGAKRWLVIPGIARIQPSEIMKIAMPLMLAWYFQRREGARTAFDFLLAGLLLAVPGFLIARQPDLGTAILVVSAGGFVIFFAGLSYKIIFGLAAIAAAAAPVLWSAMHDYQRQRVLTLIDPSADPLGKGFHIIQSTIAVGSGGLTGKGFMQGTQAHLEFIPERTTDFIFAVFSEEWGLVGNVLLLIVYAIFIGRALVIAGNGANPFMRLLAGAIALIYATYAFVNMGMVSGILPVVGVPLPWMSYGGTAMVTLAVATGILMSINRHQRLVQT
jgi:rod shape determining protein RodA